MLHFSPTPFTFWTGLAAFAAVACLAWLSWKRSARRKRTAILETLRITLAAIAVLLLWQPEWRKVRHPESHPKIALLWDASGSMATLDASLPATDHAPAEVVSREEAVRRLLDSGAWRSLENSGNNEILHLPIARPSSDGPLAGTDLSTPLTDLLEKRDDLRAVILLSDGDFNLGPPPVVAAQKMRLRGIPLFTIPFGSDTRLPDLDLLSVTAPTYGIVGENVQIPFSISSSLDREVRTIVRLRDDAGKERSKSIVLPPHATTYDSLVWRLDREESVTLELSIPVAEDERIASNNARTFTLAAKPEKIRVLVLETLPRWEYRFLRNALSRDPGVELSCLLLHPQLGPGAGTDYLAEFPPKLEDLAKFDVIFIGDIGIGEHQLTADQAALIRGLVENQASGVVFLPGPQGNQFSLLESELADLMPVQLDPAGRRGFAESLASPLILTREGRASLLTLLGENEEENPEIWRRLPGFYWHAAATRAKGGAEVLAVHGNRRGPYGPVPLLVTKPAGHGKVLFMGIDSAWRWRRGVEDLYHYRFWGQVARWMSYQRNMASGQRVRLFFTPERPQHGATVTLTANAFDPNGAPLQEGKVRIDLTSPGGRSERLELAKNDNAWGTFSGQFTIDQPGEWKIKAGLAEDVSPPLETSLLAQHADLEKTGQPARPEVLAEMARITRGRMIPQEQIADLLQELNSLPAPRPIVSRIPLVSHWLTLATVSLLAAAFWAGRKWNGTF